MEKRRFNKACCIKATKWTVICLFSTIIILFICAIVIIPVTFMLSIDFQRVVIFANFDQPSNPEFSNYRKYNAFGTRNMYITVDDLYHKTKVSLGVWHLLPNRLLPDAIANPNYDYDNALLNSGEDVVIYFHGQSGTRIFFLDTYLVLRKFFHVIAFDYRSYGDSTEAELTEEAVVHDAVQLYQKIQAKTKGKIFVWGHSLGTALSTHTVAKLSEKGVAPVGLVLEAPFTSLREELPLHPLGKLIAWLPWFEVTILDPLEKNGFYFDSKKNVLKVDCPILIMHAKDDSVIPYTLGTRLADIARTGRTHKQGNVTLELFHENLGYNHVGIHRDKHLPEILRGFIEVCYDFMKK